MLKGLSHPKTVLLTLIFLLFKSTAMAASEIRAYRSLSTQLVKTEELDKLLGNLIERGVGLREEEDFMRKEEGKLKGNKTLTSSARSATLEDTN